MPPESGRRARADQHGLLSARQPGARGFGDQEHGHRSARCRCRRSVSQDRSGAGLHARTRRDRGDQRIRSDQAIKPGDVIVLVARGPMGSGMEETYQVTSALKHLEWGREVAVVTDARFSGVSTGACIGHVGPEALAGGPIGKVREGDLVRIVVDRRRLEGSIDLVGDAGGEFGRRRRIARAGGSPPARRLAPGRPAARGHAVVGGARSAPAAARGAAACTTWSASSGCWRPESRALAAEDERNAT